VSIVRDGEEALDYVFCRGSFESRSFQRPPRLILLDLKIPKRDGLEVLREIKNDPRTHSIPVVALSSSTLATDIAEGYRLGLNSYIQKPVDFGAFCDLVDHLGHYWLGINRCSSQS
jgi:two-component system, response regulator